MSELRVTNNLFSVNEYVKISNRIFVKVSIIKFNYPNYA